MDDIEKEYDVVVLGTGTFQVPPPRCGRLLPRIVRNGAVAAAGLGHRATT